MKILIISLLVLFSHNLFSQTETDYFEIGNAKFKLGDHKGAVLSFTKAIEIDPTDSKAYYNRGLAKNILGDHRGAILDFTKAIEIYPTDSKAYLYRGLTKAKSGDHRAVFGFC
ncbi:MAG: tetratricopeptide repeat protein [Saprospiraceae bacterium]|nr:tetratricopeptide repeat protein [Saprospiraceae bacterium]